MTRKFTKYPKGYVRASDDDEIPYDIDYKDHITTGYPVGVDGTVAAYCDAYGYLPIEEIYQAVVMDTGNPNLAEKVINKIEDMRASGF